MNANADLNCKTITVPEAARVLGISSTLAYRLFQNGSLPGGLCLGARTVVLKDVFERVLRGELSVSCS